MSTNANCFIIIIIFFFIVHQQFEHQLNLDQSAFSARCLLCISVVTASSLSCLRNMKRISLLEQVMGISICSSSANSKYPVNVKSSPMKYLPEVHDRESSEGKHIVPSPGNGSKLGYPVLKRIKKDDRFASGVREHLRLGPKITEIVKAKLSLGAKIIRVGGMSKVFKKLFNVEEGERLLKTCQCYLSTTAGPIAGLLFISTQKAAFCSERSIKISSPNGEFARIHYKVVIPLQKIKKVSQSENVKKPSEKYMEIVTVDNFDFWFMGFLNYQKALNHLEQAISSQDQ